MQEKVIYMIIMKVTPVGNVLINKRQFKSANMELFYNKVIYDGEKILVYDVKDRKFKTIKAEEIDMRIHRMIINNKKFFICSMTQCH
jgi:hypothetical protein